MGKIKGMEYSDTRYNEYDEKEYFIDDWDDWFTSEEVYDRKKEIKYWTDDYANEVNENNGDGLDWSD
jgi:hypothetical protein|nr:hypothetical protein [uncultured Prevotella sp.]